MATDPFLLEQSGLNLEDALRRLHVSDENGNLHEGVSVFISIGRRLPCTELQTYAHLLKLPVLFQIATSGYNNPSDHRFSTLSHCRNAANVGGKTKT